MIEPSLMGDICYSLRSVAENHDRVKSYIYVVHATRVWTPVGFKGLLMVMIPRSNMGIGYMYVADERVNWIHTNMY